MDKELKNKIIPLDDKVLVEFRPRLVDDGKGKKIELVSKIKDAFVFNMGKNVPEIHPELDMDDQIILKSNFYGTEWDQLPNFALISARDIAAIIKN